MLSRMITVNNRAGFAFTAVPARKRTIPYICPTGEVLNLLSPPIQDGDSVGLSCLSQFFTFAFQTIASGPNAGYKYITQIQNLDTGTGARTEYNYVISPDLENTSSEFYTHQCGNYNPINNPNGFISGANLLANTIRHESGIVESHYNNYRVAQDNPANNVGAVGELLVGDPSDTGQQFQMESVSLLQQRIDAITAATRVEPCGVNFNAQCQFQGFINFFPYVPCP